MLFKAPSFWFKNSGGRWLIPAAFLYRLVAKGRAAHVRPYKASIPVICVGNLTVGGTGKTPVVLALMERLKTRGHRPHIITRGYGGHLGKKMPMLVDVRRHSTRDVGDEPLLLAAHGPVWVCASRAKAARNAADMGADVILMDDGFQNPSLVKDLSFIVVDGRIGFGNGRLLPAGPLREPIQKGLARADGVIVFGKSEQALLKHALETFSGPVISAQLSPLPETIQNLKGKPLIAFAGIGHPEKFFTTCQQEGLNIVDTVSFPDHYAYSSRDLNNLHHQAQKLSAQLITTAKDAVRLPLKTKKNVHVLDVHVVWPDPDPVDQMLHKIGL